MDMKSTWMVYKACTVVVNFIIFLEIFPEGKRPARMIILKFEINTLR